MFIFSLVLYVNVEDFDSILVFRMILMKIFGYSLSFLTVLVMTVKNC